MSTEPVEYANGQDRKVWQPRLDTGERLWWWEERVDLRSSQVTFKKGWYFTKADAQNRVHVRSWSIHPEMYRSRKSAIRKARREERRRYRSKVSVFYAQGVPIEKDAPYPQPPPSDPSGSSAGAGGR